MDSKLLDIFDFEPNWIDEEYQYQEWKNKSWEQLEAEEHAYYDELKYSYKTI